jgi:hypothetical protein
VRGDILLDAVLVVIDRRRAELFNEREAPRRTRREYVRADRARKLDGDVSNTAGATMDQHILASLSAGTVDQSFPRRDENQGQGRCVPHAQIDRLACQQCGIDRGILGKRAGHAAHPAGHAIDLVALAERGNSRSNRLDDAGKVDAENRGEGMARMRRDAGPDLRVQWIDAARGNPDQHLSRRGFWPLDGCEPERHLGAIEKCGLHSGFSIHFFRYVSVALAAIAFSAADIVPTICPACSP